MSNKELHQCYYCYHNKANCQLVEDNEKTIAYLMGEQTYICKDCDYFLKVGKIMSEQGVNLEME